MTRSVVVAIPAFNEQSTVDGVVIGVRSALPEAIVVVVDDSSTDETARRARDAGALTLQMPFNVGVGGAMRAAFLYARSIGADYLVQVDGDGQHDPSSIPDLLDALNDASVVVGSRFGSTSDDAWVGKSRRLVMNLLARLVSGVTRTRLDDVTSGFRAADSRAIELFSRSYPSEYLGDTIESIVIASRSGLRVAQVPVRMLPRQGGRPSHGLWRSGLFLGRALMAVGVAMTRRGAGEV